MDATAPPSTSRRTFLRQLGLTLAAATGLTVMSQGVANAEDASYQCGVICYKVDICQDNCPTGQAQYECHNQCTGQVTDVGCRAWGCRDTYCLSQGC